MRKKTFATAAVASSGETWSRVARGSRSQPPPRRMTRPACRPGPSRQPHAGRGRLLTLFAASSTSWPLSTSFPCASSRTVAHCPSLPLAMVFSFSFNVPGISNPFTQAAAAASESAPVPKLQFDTSSQPSVVPRRRPPSPSLLPPLSRKRGWVPSSSEPSRPAPMHTSTIGYLDTPAKYRDMVDDSADQNEIEELVVGEHRFFIYTGHLRGCARMRLVCVHVSRIPTSLGLSKT